MDHYRLPMGGHRRAWIIVMQLGLILTIALLANMQPAMQATQMGIIALVIAFFSASQDIAIDAYRTNILQDDERGLGAAYYVFAYRLAMLVSGGMALICADYVGWKITYQLMCVLMVLSLLIASRAPQTSEPELKSSGILKTVTASLSDLMQHDKIILLLLLIVLYKFGDALAASLMTNFLLHGLGFTLTEVGLAFKVVSFIAIVLGAFVGGLILTRWNIYRGLLVFGLAQAFANLMFVALAIIGKDFFMMAFTVFIDNFCSGLSTAALLAFMMSLCNKRYSAGQFAILSAIASLGRVMLGPVAAVMVLHFGWVSFFTWSFILSLPGIVILIWLKNEVSAYAHATVN
jgi:PAT family beta-lactamase induction signal transducer AmpG